MFRFFIKRPARVIDDQINGFIEWKSQYSMFVEEMRFPLMEFSKLNDFFDVVDIKFDHLVSYVQTLKTKHTPYGVTERMRVIRMFLRYCRRRGHNCLIPDFIKISDQGDIQILNELVKHAKVKPMTTLQVPIGRRPNISVIRQVVELKKNTNLSQRAIARAVDRHVSQINTWLKQPPKSLPAELVQQIRQLSPVKVDSVQ